MNRGKSAIWKHALTMGETEVVQDKYRTDGQIIGKLWSINRGRLSRLKAGLVR